jgi:cytochrome c oxidase subunit 4
VAVRLVLTWIGLMLLLALTFGSSYVPLGAWNTAINMAVSCAKALLIALFFMELRGAGALLRLAAIVGVIWLALLFGLSGTDYATRANSPAPWSAVAD